MQNRSVHQPWTSVVELWKFVELIYFSDASASDALWATRIIVLRARLSRQKLEIAQPSIQHPWQSTFRTHPSTPCLRTIFSSALRKRPLLATSVEIRPDPSRRSSSSETQCHRYFYRNQLLSVLNRNRESSSRTLKGPISRIAASIVPSNRLLYAADIVGSG